MSSVISASSFHRQLLRCFQNNVPNKIVLALSGGVDSMCLAYLLSQYKKQSHPQLSISAVTIDHGYRKESAEEAEKIGSIVRQWGISHYVEKLSYSKDVHTISNFEEVARNLRYDVFQKKCVDKGINALLVAHNKDDQLETFLQRLQMNSTMFGLLGLRQKALLPLTHSSPHESDKIHVYRPLLDFEKSQIRKTCVENSVPWFEDLSNQDISLTQRNLLRYMINEYVPNTVTMRPDLECITRESLAGTIRKIERFVESYEIQKSCLHEAVTSSGFHIDTSKPEIKFSIPLREFKKLQQPVVARWMYELIYPLSSAKNFHWSYAKLERQAMPRLWDWVEIPHNPLIMTYLNVRFDVKLKDSVLYFHFSSQPPQKDVASTYQIKILTGDTSWHIFDRIWWIKLETLKSDACVCYYNPLMKENLLSEFPDMADKMRLSGAKAEKVPVVFDVMSGQIISVPTLGTVKEGLKASYMLKTGINTYSCK